MAKKAMPAKGKLGTIPKQFPFASKSTPKKSSKKD